MPLSMQLQIDEEKSFQVSEKDTKAPLKKCEGVYINVTLHVCCFVTNRTKLVLCQN